MKSQCRVTAVPRQTVILARRVEITAEVLIRKMPRTSQKRSSSKWPVLETPSVSRIGAPRATDGARTILARILQAGGHHQRRADLLDAACHQVGLPAATLFETAGRIVVLGGVKASPHAATGCAGQVAKKIMCVCKGRGANGPCQA